jgi:hypothetical protein
MASPDMNSKINFSSGTSLFSSLPFALMVFLLYMILFNYENELPFFNIIYIVIIPLILYVISCSINILHQYISCKNTDMGKGFTSGIPFVISLYLFMIISSFNFSRKIVVSAIAPLFVSQNSPLLNKKTLENISFQKFESLFPQSRAIAYAFYLFFAAIFGQMLGSGISQIC